MDRLDMCVIASDYFLVHPLGMGDEPGGAVAGGNFLADVGDGRRGRSETVGGFRFAMGRGSVDQSVAVVVSAGFGVVGMVEAREARTAVTRRSCVGGSHVFGVHSTLAGAQLSHLWGADFYPIEFWGGTAAGQRTWSEWVVDGIPTSDKERSADGVVSRDG